MSGVFVGLVFNFCAGISDVGVLQIGYKSGDTCVVKIESQADNKDSDHPVVNAHTLGWEMLEGGAEVAIDGQKFVILKFREA